MKKILNIFQSILDRILFFALAPLLLGVMYIISKFYKRKMRNKGTRSENNKILFLASGKPVKYPGFKDIGYYNMWHNAFQKQLCLPYFATTYVFYDEAEGKEIYKLTSGVIALTQSFFKRESSFSRIKILLTSLKSFLFLSSLIFRTRPRIIYTNAPGNNMFMAPLLSYFYGIDLVAQVMGSYDLASFEDSLQKEPLTKLLRRNLDKLIYSFFFRQTSLVLAYNKYCGTFAIHNGAHPSKVRNLHITPHYYDENSLKILSKHEIDYPKTEKNIILWSRFSSEKKNTFAIKGALEALKEDTSLGLILVGYGPLYNQVKDFVDSSGVTERVFLYEFMPFHKLMSFIHHSQIALLPLGGYALVEAALLKKPIVCFDMEWHHELLSDNAYFADYPDGKQIRRAILEILAHPLEAQKRAENAYLRAKNMFCPLKIKDKEDETIRNFIHQE